MEILEEDTKVDLDNINITSNQPSNSNYQDLLEDFDANIDLTVVLRDKI